TDPRSHVALQIDSLLRWSAAGLLTPRSCGAGFVVRGHRDRYEPARTRCDQPVLDSAVSATSLQEGIHFFNAARPFRTKVYGAALDWATARAPRTLFPPPLPSQLAPRTSKRASASPVWNPLSVFTSTAIIFPSAAW